MTLLLADLAICCTKEKSEQVSKRSFDARSGKNIRTGFQLTDLHGSGAGEDISCLSHETGRVNLRSSGNNLRLSDPLLLSSRRQGSGDFGTEDDILDEDTFNGDTPLIRNVSNDLGDFECNGFTFGDDTLHGTSTDDMTEGSLGSLDQRLSQVADTERRAVGIDNLEVDNRVTVANVSKTFLGQIALGTLTSQR